MSLKSIVFYILAVAVAVASAFGFADFRPGPEVEGLAVLVVAGINLYLHWRNQNPPAAPAEPAARPTAGPAEAPPAEAPHATDRM